MFSIFYLLFFSPVSPPFILIFPEFCHFFPSFSSFTLKLMAFNSPSIFCIYLPLTFLFISPFLYFFPLFSPQLTPTFWNFQVMGNAESLRNALLQISQRLRSNPPKENIQVQNPSFPGNNSVLSNTIQPQILPHNTPQFNPTGALIPSPIIPTSL